ncbi:MAG: alpha-L-fucosidase [Bacteroidales bacterium]
MKNLTFFLLLLFAVQMQAQDIPFKNTYKIEEGDSHADIIKKAAHVIPTQVQFDALKNEYIAFIHFGPNTFTRKEWGTGKEDPAIFDLKELDTDQWCEALKAAGMKMVVITVKHHDGFVLWQSRYTKHGIMSTGFRNGKGDILKDLSASCQKYGLKLGVYLSPADLYQIENPEGLYGNLSEYTTRTIPRGVEGRPFENKTKFEFLVDDYNEYFLNQLFEILTEYGNIHEVWFDGAHPKRKGGQTYNYKAWMELIRTLAPDAVVFGREDIRWCGNESGATRATEWNVLPYELDPNETPRFPDLRVDDLASNEKLYDAKYLHYHPAETNTSIRAGWFYRDDERQQVRSVDDVFDIYERSVGGNSIFLLNIPPNRRGRFSDKDVEVLKETGKLIQETYGTDLLAGAKGAKEILDNDENTYVSIENSNQDITISMPSPITINRLVIQEAVNTHGERVEKHVVDAWIGGQWKELVSSTNIGYKRILRFADVTSDKIRIRFPEFREAPAISKVSAHHYKARPPRLTYNRTIEGMVSLMPMKSDFNWKPHGENAAGNLNAGYKIYYTLDGKTPDTDSKEYDGAFDAEAKTLKAVAILNGEKGAVFEEQLGFAKKDWKLLSDNGSNKSENAAFDENNGTSWLSATDRSIVVDLSKIHKLTGFAYTPPQNRPKGLMLKGTIKVSKDNKTWTDVGSFEFGNLINDPSKRFYHFDKTVDARYIRIEAGETTENADAVIIAELDLF